ncbi:hypothetical protein ACJX0J_020139 [Zea mays]
MMLQFSQMAWMGLLNFGQDRLKKVFYLPVDYFIYHMNMKHIIYELIGICPVHFNIVVLHDILMRIGNTFLLVGILSSGIFIQNIHYLIFLMLLPKKLVQRIENYIIYGIAKFTERSGLSPGEDNITQLVLNTFVQIIMSTRMKYLIPIFSLQFWCYHEAFWSNLDYLSHFNNKSDGLGHNKGSHIKLSFIFYMFFFFGKMAFPVKELFLILLFLHSINTMGEHTPEEAFGLCMLMLLIISLLVLIYYSLYYTSHYPFLLMQHFLLASSISASVNESLLFAIARNCTHIGLGIFFYATTFYRIHEVCCTHPFVFRDAGSICTISILPLHNLRMLDPDSLLFVSAVIVALVFTFPYNLQII